MHLVGNPFCKNSDAVAQLSCIINLDRTPGKDAAWLASLFGC